MASPMPWRVRIHYDGARVRHDQRRCPDIEVFDYSDPIDVCGQFADAAQALAVAQTASHRGGSATVWYRDPATGTRELVVSYEPHDVALAELLDEARR